MEFKLSILFALSLKRGPLAVALSAAAMILAGQATVASATNYLLEVREITALNPPFSRNVYVAKPECTVEQFEAIVPPANFEKAPAKVLLPEVTAILPTPPDGVAEYLDLIPEVAGNDFVFVAQLETATVLGSDPVFGIFVRATVRRDTSFRFPAGQVVHIVTDPAGDRYVLQAFAVSMLGQYDPAVVDGLAGSPLPSGWTYASELLTEDLVANSEGLATVFAQGQYATWQRLPRPSECPATPATCREPLQARKSRLQVVDSADDTADRLSWTWGGGPATPVEDFGNPRVNQAYQLCVYEDGALLSSFAVPQGATFWQAKSYGFVYDNEAGSTDGITDLRLKQGATERKAKIGVKGSGAALALTDTGAITGVLQVQLRNDQEICWGAVYSPPFQKQGDGKLTTVSDAP